MIFMDPFLKMRGTANFDQRDDLFWIHCFQVDKNAGLNFPRFLMQLNIKEICFFLKKKRDLFYFSDIYPFLYI